MLLDSKGETSGPGTPTHHWELLTSDATWISQVESGAVQESGLNVTEHKNASFSLQIWIEVETGIAKNESVLLMCSGDGCLTLEK